MNMDPEEIRILRSMSMAQKFQLIALLTTRAGLLYRQKLERELPEWTSAEIDRLTRAANMFGTIDTGEHWRVVYDSEQYQAWLAGEGARC